MKVLKQAAFVVGLFIATAATAQNSDMRNMLKLGINGGFALPSNNASGALGVDLAYQNLGVPGFGLGVATGYTHYFAKKNDNIENNDFGVIPVAALIRFYPQQSGFYFGADLGYGIITGDKKVAKNSAVERPTGGFYINPEIGYHNRDWNFGVHYQRTFTGDKGTINDQKFAAGNLGASISYNIPLGK